MRWCVCVCVCIRERVGLRCDPGGGALTRPDPGGGVRWRRMRPILQELMAAPTQDELRELEHTEHLFKSNLFKMQVSWL